MNAGQENATYNKYSFKLLQMIFNLAVDRKSVRSITIGKRNINTNLWKQSLRGYI